MVFSRAEKQDQMEAFVVLLLLCVAASSLLLVEPGFTVFNVFDFGATGDGRTDDSEAFTKAWEALCEARMSRGSAPVLNIPSGKTFLLQPVKFSGPCTTGKAHIRVAGNIVAPRSISAWKNWKSGSWLSFSNVENLTIAGSAQIDGQGWAWWTHSNEIYKNKNRPTALYFHNCNNLVLSGLTHINSPRNHISINDCTGVIISHLNIIAPQDSPNTDGIDISQSSYVKIRDSYIGTGDDCVAVNGNSSHIRIINVVCGPGHGISVGSLGEHGCTDTVEEVHVRNCTLNGTQNGVRIKTWQGGKGFARRISFTQITLIASQNPIIIDQNYCGGERNCKKGKTAVKVSDVTYSDVKGTSAQMDAIKLDCSQVGCTNIIMQRINITPAVPSVNQTDAYSKNVRGTSSNVKPHVNCLSGSR